MAFKSFNGTKRKPQLHSLIDMSFILLLFFLVTSMIVQMKEKEQKLAIPTPKNEPGRAQILVQFIDESEILYLDETASAIVKDITETYGWRPEEWQKQEMIRQLKKNKIVDRSVAMANLKNLKQRAQAQPDRRFFVLIRCPDDLPYYHAIDIIHAISSESNIQYGCVGGSFADIEKARRIALVVESAPEGGDRENLVIEF